MNKDEFTGYLQDTGKLNSESIISLNELIKEFPYCQSSHILLTLNLFKEKDVRYDAELRTTAGYVSNRGLLRKYIENLSVVNVKNIVSNQETTVHAEPDNKKNIGADDTSAEKKTANNDTPQTDSSDQIPVDDAKAIAEVKSILERHIKELENELENKKRSTARKNVKTHKSKTDIINEFIKNEPSISRPKASFYNPVEKARESIVDNENIVSETLAGIFYDQGYLHKAIKIYQKLSLKFPEKSSYFAALIKKAEKELES